MSRKRRQRKKRRYPGEKGIKVKSTKKSSRQSLQHVGTGRSKLKEFELTTSNSKLADALAECSQSIRSNEAKWEGSE